MLRFLRIRDFALIRELEMEFSEGLTVLTGETGSGKSILVDALGFLAGARSDPGMVRTDCPAAILEGVFTVEENAVAERLAESGIDSDDGTLLVRREISAAGRGRVFLNNSLVSLSLLKSIGGALADIHGQQENQALADSSSQLEWLDRYGGNDASSRTVHELYGAMREIARRLQALAMDEQERQRLLDILRFQADEIRRADIRPGEKEELEKERSLLANREKVCSLVSDAYSLLYENENSIVGQTERLVRILQHLVEFDSGWSAHLEALRESLFRLEEVCYVARDYAGNLDFSPDRLNQVEQRLAEFARLCSKYGSSTEAVVEFGKQCEARLAELDSSKETSIQLTQEMDAAWQRYLQAAEALSGKRRRDAGRLERDIKREFRALAMERMELHVDFRARERSARLHPGQVPAWCGSDGLEHVEFLLAPNVGEEMRPLARIASGGELSRIMLAIKTLCKGNEKGKSLVFDEIDAGIGGRVADAVGRRLREVSAHNQVFCVTHLPQIAAYATDHFSVLKAVVGGRTETRVERLDSAARVQELARMMGGKVVTETTQRHAQELIAYAGRGKK
jgi:DNA repair protein RecN (Recombination protein N)